MLVAEMHLTALVCQQGSICTFAGTSIWCFLCVRGLVIPQQFLFYIRVRQTILLTLLITSTALWNCYIKLYYTNCSQPLSPSLPPTKHTHKQALTNMNVSVKQSSSITKTVPRLRFTSVWQHSGIIATMQLPYECINHCSVTNLRLLRLMFVGMFKRREIISGSYINFLEIKVLSCFHSHNKW